MNVNLPPYQHDFIESLVDSGQYASTDEAISASVQLLISREILKREVQIGIDEADRGEVIDHDTVWANLRAKAERMVREQSEK